MSDLLTDVDLKTERATEPPKRWRNKFWYEFRVRHQGGHELGPGIVWSVSTFPARDEAERHARAQVRDRWIKWPEIMSGIEYLGAFPDGEAP